MFILLIFFGIISQVQASQINPYQFKYQFRRYIKKTFQLKGHQVKLTREKMTIKNKEVSWSGSIKIETMYLSQLIGKCDKDFLFDIELQISNMKVNYNDQGKIINHNLLSADTHIHSQIFVSKNSLNDLIAQHINSEKKLDVFVFDIKNEEFLLHAKGGNGFGGVRFYVQSQPYLDSKNIGIKIIDQKISTYGFGKLKYNSFKEMLSNKVNELQFQVPKSPLFKKVKFSSCVVTNKGVYLKLQKLSMNHDNIMISKLIKENFN